MINSNYISSVTASASLTAGQNLDLSCEGLGTVTVNFRNQTDVVNFQASVDGTNFYSILGIDLQLLNGQLQLSTNVNNSNWGFAVAGIKTLRMNLPSGTVDVAMYGSPGSNIQQATLAYTFIKASDGDLFGAGGRYNSPLPTLTNGSQGQIQLDSSSRQIIAPLTNSSIVKSQMQDNSGNGLTSHAPGSARALDVSIVDGSGNQITSFGGGTQYADGAARGTSTGTLMMVDDGVNVQSAAGTTAGLLKVDLSGTAANSTAVKVDGSAVTQPISAASLPLPSGAATAAKQPALGTAGSASADVITIQGVASMTAVKVDGSAVTQPVSGTVTANAGTNLNTSALALETGGNLATVKTNTDNLALAQASTTSGQKGNLILGAVTTAAPTYTTGQSNPLSLTTTGALRVDNSAVTQPVSGTVTANQGGAPWSANITQFGGTNLSTGTGAGGTGIPRVTVSDDSTVNGPTLTKGTQGSTGYSVQNLKDASRTPLRFYAVAAAAGTTGTETAITLTKSSGTAATSTGTSFVITNGKTFRIEAITFATRGHNTATAQTTTFNFRLNTAGAVTTSSTPIILAMRSATPATANAWDRVIVPIPDGMEIAGNGTLQFGITAAATYTTNAPTWDVTIIGFEY